MAMFTEEKIRAAFQEALERDPEDSVDLLDHVLRELGIALADERDLSLLLGQLHRIPEIDSWIKQRKIEIGTTAVAQGQERLGRWVTLDWTPDGPSN